MAAQGIDELRRCMHNQLVNGGTIDGYSTSSRAVRSGRFLTKSPRVEPVASACHREASRALRLSRFQGRCLLAGMRNQRRRLAIGEALSEQPSGYATTIRFAPGTSQQAPSCRQGAATQRSGHASAPPEKTSVLGLSAGPLGSRYGPPVLIPHAPVPKGNAIYRGPERGTNPPALFAGARGSSSSTLGRPTVVFRSASRPQVGGLTSDSPSAGQGPLVKAPETVRRPVRVGRLHGIGIARPEESRRQSSLGIQGS